MSMSQFIEERPNDPYVFIQWKGTDVCMDFYCECGEHCHFDGDFAYAVRCPHCDTVWEMPSYVTPRKVAFDYSNPIKDMLPDEERSGSTTIRPSGTICSTCGMSGSLR